MKSLLSSAAILMAMPFAALAEYPDRPVSFIIPWPPGDLEDLLTRMIAEDFQETYGVPAAVVNKPGGGGGPFPGAVEVATAPADGTVIGSFVNTVPLTGHKVDIAELTPAKFDPIGIFLTYPFVMAASGDAPYKTMAELAAHAKDNDVVFGHFGDVQTSTKTAMALVQSLDFEWTSSAAFDSIDCNTLASGDADVVNTTLQVVLPCIDDINVLMSYSTNRNGLLPDTETIGEVNPDFSMSFWNGLFVHKDTPQDVRDKIAAVAEMTMVTDRAQQLATETGALVYWLDAEGSEALIESDRIALELIDSVLE